MNGGPDASEVIGVTDVDDDATVIVSRGYYAAAKHYHLPEDGDDETPRCSAYRSNVKWRTTELWKLGPRAELCKMCDPDHERPVSHTGPTLASKLHHADWEDVVADGSGEPDTPEFLYTTVSSPSKHWFEVYPADGEDAVVELRAIDNSQDDREMSQTYFGQKLDDDESGWSTVYDGVREENPTPDHAEQEAAE